MTLSISTLAAIQKVGAAAFSADAKLKIAARDYAERVSAAITESPDKPGNDTLIENWKVVARLSQTLEGIEEELKKVYQVASRLTADDQAGERELPVPVKPTRSVGKAKKRAAKTMTPAAAALQNAAQQNLASQADLSPTDVVAKPRKKAVSPKAKVSKAKVGDGAAKPLVTGSNPAKLLMRLEGLLNASEFTGISQTLVAQETGIPLGSMTAAIKKLVEMGWLVIGPNGSLKLTTAPSTVAPTSELPLAA